MKYELVISAWDDDIFKFRARFTYSSFDDMENLISEILDKIKIKEQEEYDKRQKYLKQLEDDDIPF